MKYSETFVAPRRPPSPLRATTIALSGSVDGERLRRGIARLAELGVVHDEPAAALAEWRYFAGDDRYRLDALAKALKGPADVVLFARGGYGLSRLLSAIDWKAVAGSQKIFCGYSDVTAFSLAALAYERFITLSGPVTAGEFAQTDDLAARDFSELHFFGLLAANEYRYPSGVSDLAYADQHIEGTLWGTNLAIITHLVGTPFFPEVGDGILVLEDIGEAPYRVERMFWQLKHAGVLDRQRAIVLGAFTDCDPAPGMRYPYSMTEVIETLRGIAPCPVLTGFPFGHVPGKVTMPMGAPASLEIAGVNYTLSVRDYLR
jgi:muramoyltetrapeptide carboxypeptidase